MKKILVTMMLAGSMAHAADVPVMNVPTVNQRMKSARAAIAQGDWRTAKFETQKVVDAEPSNADAHNLLAYSYRKQQTPNLAKAFEHYQRALQLNPQHRGAHEYIGEAYLMDRKPQQAEKHLAALEAICGNRQCEEYQDLAQALAAYRTANP
nr:tetratricopeptide repeat protein [uncultured Rhodoferax sp.]